MAQLGIFVSHSSHDGAFCRTLVHGLKRAGADVWFDEQNLGPVTLREEISRQLVSRPIFVVVLSQAALSSKWVRDECEWAYQLLSEEPTRIMLPVLAQPITLADFNASALLYLKGMKRIEDKGLQPFPTERAVQQTLRLLELANPSEGAQSAPPPAQRDPADDLVRGKALVAQGSVREGSDLLKAASETAPMSFETWVNLGEGLRQQGDWQGAVTAYDRAAALNDESWAAWYGKGDALNHLQRHGDALAALEHAISILNETEPLTPPTKARDKVSEWGTMVGASIAIIGGILRGGPTLTDSFGDVGDSNALLRSILPRYGHHAQTWTGCGDARLGLTHYSKALAAYDNALTAIVSYSPALRGKAAVFRALGQVTEAQQIEQTLQQRNW